MKYLGLLMVASCVLAMTAAGLYFARKERTERLRK